MCVFAELTRRKLDENNACIYMFLPPSHHVFSIPFKSHHDLHPHQKERGSSIDLQAQASGNKGENEGEFLYEKQRR